jgi:hypothetical protein
MRGPPKSQYFLGKGKQVSDFCIDVSKFGEIERLVDTLRMLFELKEEEDTFVSD